MPLKGASSWNPCIRHHCMAEFTPVFPARAMAVCTRSMLRKLGALGEILPCSNRRLPVSRLMLLPFLSYICLAGSSLNSSRLRKKGVSVKLPCKLSPELDDIRPKRVLKSRTLLFSW